MPCNPPFFDKICCPPLSFFKGLLPPTPQKIGVTPSLFGVCFAPSLMTEPLSTYITQPILKWLCKNLLARLECKIVVCKTSLLHYQLWRFRDFIFHLFGIIEAGGIRISGCSFILSYNIHPPSIL